MEKKLYLVTTRDGKTSYTAALTDNEKSELIGGGATVQDPATGSDGSSSIVLEANGEKITKNDLLNLVKDLDASVRTALRKNEDNVSYTQQFFNRKTNSIIDKVSFGKNRDNPGAPSEYRFEFKIGNKKVAVKAMNGTYIDVAQIILQSGTVGINRDVATDVLYNLIKNVNNTSGYAGKKQSEQGNLDEFKIAVDKFKKLGQSKEAIKELLKASRSFPGDDIQHKFLNAVTLYRGSCPNCQDPEPTIEPQVNSPQDPRSETDCEEASLHLDMSLFIRLLEYAREESKVDVDLHFVAENLQKVCIDKGCAGMDDYGFIISKSTQSEEHDSQPVEKKIDESEEIEWPDGEKPYSSLLFEKLEIAYDTITKECSLDAYPESNDPIILVSAVASDYDLRNYESYLDNYPQEDAQFRATNANLEVLGGYQGDIKFSQEEASQMLRREDFNVIKQFALANFEAIK